ncbi:hypothetical protein ACS0TY_012160 [Phlomoides rotata]
MDVIQVISFNFTTLLLLFFSSFIFLLIKACKKPKSLQNLPPSPPIKLPIIGHLHLLTGGLAHEALRRVSQKYGPIVSLQLGEIPTVVISSREAAKEVLKVQDPACAERPGSIVFKTMYYDYSNIAFSAYGEYWRQMRRICIQEMLGAKNVRSFGYIRQDEIRRLVQSLQSKSGQAVNITEMMCAFTCAVTCRVSFGKVMKGRDTLTAMMRRITLGGFGFAEVFPSFKLARWVTTYKLMRIWRKVDAILDVIVEEHRRNKSGEYDGEDVLDVFLRMQKNKQLHFPISNDNIKAVILDMFTGGTETSTTTTNWAMAELMRNPRVMAKVQSEIREALKGKTNVEESDVQGLIYLKSVIKETLRLHPPIPLLPRACRDECKVQGYTIPIKTKVVVNIWSMGRDPEYWKDPEIFQPERFYNISTNFLGNDFEFIPFGSGRRSCPGLNFGLANVELPLAQLLYHFDWKLPEGMNHDDVDMTAIEEHTVVRKNPLFLVAMLYNPSNEQVDF